MFSLCYMEDIGIIKFFGLSWTIFYNKNFFLSSLFFGSIQISRKKRYLHLRGRPEFFVCTLGGRPKLARRGRKSISRLKVGRMMLNEEIYRSIFHDCSRFGRVSKNAVINLINRYLRGPFDSSLSWVSFSRRWKINVYK
jgi:hypothetical protein